MKGPDVLFRYLPFRISKAVMSLPSGILSNANEIRLRSGGALTVTSGGKNIPVSSNGRPCRLSEAVRTTKSEIEECVALITQGSLYRYDDCVSQGFVPLPEGGRAGICGKALVRDGRIIGFSEILSVNLRIHRSVNSFAEPLIRQFGRNGISGAIVISPPGVGKTTFLRSAAFLLATGDGTDCHRVGIADEREELTAGLDCIGMTDIITGVKKERAIEMLVRTMSPEVIICDEISPSEEAGVMAALNTGVSVIASAHATDLQMLMARKGMRDMLLSGAFKTAVELGADKDGRTVRLVEI